MSIAEIYDVVFAEVNSVEVTTVSSLYKLLLSLVLGSMVGYERKRRGQSAGVRTFSLIAMGSTLAMILSIYVPQEYLGLKNGDPGRIAAQVVTGIGFLGAGAIIQMKGSVRGLTTAAGIWMVAAIGMSVGVGMYVVAVISTLLILVILVWLDKVEHRANIGANLRTVRLTLGVLIDSIQPYKEILDARKVAITRYDVEYNYANGTTEIMFIVIVPEGVDMISLSGKLRNIYPTQTLSISNQSNS